MTQQKTKLTYQSSYSSFEMMKRTTIILIVINLNMLLLSPVHALMSVRQIQSSMGHPFSTSPARGDVCPFATTAATATTEEVVERSSRKIVQRDASEKKRELYEVSEINGSKSWELRLYNDESNFEFWVAEQLVKIVGLSEREAFDTMKLAGITGQSTIGSYDCFELAEYYHTALQAEGLAVKLLPVL